MIISADFCEVDETIVTIRMTAEQAGWLTLELSDLLCWARRFRAVLPEDTDRWPMGIDGVRELNIALKSAINKAEGPQK